MILYLLLIVFLVLLALIALGLTIGGLVKRKQKLWIASLASLVVLVIGIVFSSYIYVKESINYMGSKEFQDDTKQKAANVGKTWGNTVTGTAQGLEETLDDDAIAALASKGGKIVGRGVKAASEGLDETVGKTTVFLDASAGNEGIVVGRAEAISNKGKNIYGLFLEFKKDFDGTLILTAYDSKGLKEDVAGLKLLEKAGKSKVYAFQFEYFNPGLSGYCILSKK